MQETKRDDGKSPDRSMVKICAYCKYWRPNVFYPYIGYCEKHNKMTFDTDSCDNFEPIRLKSGELYWCSTCRTRVTGEEAEVLVRFGHRIHRNAYVDPDIKEELYSVF